MSNFFNTIINTLIRNLSYGVRVTISAGLFVVALISLKLSIKKKNDTHPIAWGWMILCLISAFLSVIYLVL